MNNYGMLVLHKVNNGEEVDEIRTKTAQVLLLTDITFFFFMFYLLFFLSKQLLLYTENLPLLKSLENWL